jgi:hypothetical protein
MTDASKTIPTPRRGWKRSPAHPQTVAARQRLDRLAELVADGATLAAAGRELGVRQSRVGQLWKKVCDGLGETVR